MTPTRQLLLDMITDPDAAYSRPRAEVEALQLKAAQELFEERRKQIPLVARRAEDSGITAITRLDDIVPLLFAHTVYKSYPPSFIEKNQWQRMNQWLNTLSVEDSTQLDVSGVNNVDDWIDRLWANGHRVLATSGSSGKCSFLNHTQGDQDIKKRHFKYSVGWPFVRSSPDRPLFWLGPIKGPNSAIESAIFNAENWGRPGATYALDEQPLKISEVSKMAAMRKRMAQGDATPQEIAEFETQTAIKGAQGQAELMRLIDLILDHRHEPIFVTGLWAQHMMLIRRARERGIGDGEFHPNTIVNAGGGVKGIALPDDYKEQVDRFYGRVIRPGAYGMTEMAQLLPRCEHGRYHRAPGLIIMVLDPDGDRLLTEADADENHQITGRFAFLDLAYEGRWGGLITGDKLTVDFSPTCGCGRPGPALLDNIGRFAQAGEEDHIGCAGTIDSYIRGALV